MTKLSVYDDIPASVRFASKGEFTCVAFTGEQKPLRNNMKPFWICFFVIITVYGISFASEDTSKDEVPVVDEMQESFHQRISIDEKFSHPYAVIEIHLTSVKMLVSLRVDTKNRNLVTTTLLQEGVGNETKQTQLEKESNPQNVVSANNGVSWIDRAWVTLHGVMISLFRWTELSNYINPQTFTLSSPVMSAADFTCPGDGSVNRSLFNLNGTNGTKSNSPATETMKTNETSQQSGREPFVILIEDDDQYWMPRFYLTSQIDDTKHSDILPTEIVSPKNVPNNQNTIMSFVSEDNSTTTSNEHSEPAVTLIEENPSQKDNGSWTLITSGNATSVEKEDEILTVKLKETPPSTNNTGNYSAKFSGDIHNAEIDSESHGNIPTVTGHPTKMNITQEELVCPYQPVEDGHWMMAAEQGVCLKDNGNVSLEFEDKTPLTLTNLTIHGSKSHHILKARKTLRNNWIKQTMAGHQPDMCPLGSRRPGLKLQHCTNNATNSPPSDGFRTWFSPVTVWNSFKAGIQWLQSNQTHEKARNMVNYYRTRFQIRMTHWTWQDTIDSVIICWMTTYCATSLFKTVCFVTEIIRIKRFQREKERERLRALELERLAKAQPKPWQPKPKKKRHKKIDDW